MAPSNALASNVCRPFFSRVVSSLKDQLDVFMAAAHAPLSTRHWTLTSPRLDPVADPPILILPLTLVPFTNDVIAHPGREEVIFMMNV